jgi:hypothetical protein
MAMLPSWGIIPGPARGVEPTSNSLPPGIPSALDCLDRVESALYADLISNVYAPSVRLEQERISLSAVEKAVVGC